jgi:hypothetical protein
MMSLEEFERLNELSEKALNETASEAELKEFSALLASWNASAELRLYGGYIGEKEHYQPPSTK